MTARGVPHARNSRAEKHPKKKHPEKKTLPKKVSKNAKKKQKKIIISEKLSENFSGGWGDTPVEIQPWDPQPPSPEKLLEKNLENVQEAPLPPRSGIGSETRFGTGRYPPYYITSLYHITMTQHYRVPPC